MKQLNRNNFSPGDVIIDNEILNINIYSGSASRQGNNIWGPNRLRLSSLSATLMGYGAGGDCSEQILFCWVYGGSNPIWTHLDTPGGHICLTFE